jgi:peptidoglycan/xylan/chitin deacetylase (PgdA/CDA1 family)
LYTYHHNAFGAGSVTAGSFATAYPAEYSNAYFFGDYVQNWIKIMRVNENDYCVTDANHNCTSIEDFIPDAGGPVEIVTGPDGNIYYLAIYTGELNRILYTNGNHQPVALIHASATSGATPLPVDFSSAGSTDPDAADVLSYSWNFGDGTPVSNVANPSHIYQNAGTYTAVLTLSDGKGGVNIKSISIAAGNQAPVATITSPLTGSLYLPNQTIQLSGSGFDPEEGALSGANLSWDVLLHHNTHTHTLYTKANGNALTGTNPSFLADDHQATDIYLEVKLTATDSAGLTNTKSINLYLNNSGANVAGNLILNPSVETNGTAGRPEHWNQGGYGNNGRSFTYPVPGFVGDKAIKLDMLSYVDGDAKWFPDPMYVVPGATYHFSDSYKSTAPSYVTVQFSCNNGQYDYQQILSLPSTADTWQQSSGTFDVLPSDVCFGQYPVAVSVFHQMRSTGSLTLDNYTLMLNDVQAPTVSVTAPTNGQTISAPVTVTADAADNIGVLHVHFFVDGTEVGQDQSAPYTVELNPIAFSNGSHTITAQAHDFVGNLTMSAPVVITVANQRGVNLIQNPSFEISGGLDPAYWFRGGYGSVTPTFTYPIEGADGTQSKGAQVSFVTPSDGDAKWYFSDVPVTPGQYYAFEDKYKSDVQSFVNIRYTFANNSVIYVPVVTLPASSTWQSYSTGFIVPEGVVSLTIFHFIQAAGSLAVDDYSLIHTDNPNAFSEGMVSLTFDDGWNSIFENAIPILDAAGLKSTQYVVSGQLTGTTALNLFPNPSLEIPSDHNAPLHWLSASSGNNNAVFSYEGVEGVEGPGSSAVKTQITSYVDGDAKWFVEDIPVTPEQDYVYSEKYKSDTESSIVVRYTMTDNSFVYDTIATLPASDPAGEWKSVSYVLLIPNHAQSLTVFHVLESVGTLYTDDFSFTSDTEGRVNISDVLAAKANGHDIAAHSRTHPSLLGVSAAQLPGELGGSKSDFIGLGLGSPDNFAYPYGDYNASIKQAVHDAGFGGARGVDRGFNLKNTDRYALKIQQIDATTQLSQIRSWIDTATSTKTWLILMFHQVDESGAAYSVTPATLQGMVDYLSGNNVPVVTVSQGLTAMDAGTPINPDTEAPIITALGPLSVTVRQGSVYHDLSATAVDAIDGNLTNAIVVTSNVNTAVVGTYQVRYNVEDAAHNHAIEVVRTVRVTDSLIPIIADHANVSALATSTAGAYVDYGVPVVTDNVDAPSSALCTPTTGSLFPIGVTNIICSASDAEGNHATPTQFTVTVLDLAISAQLNSRTTVNEVTINWTTNHAATSRVLYDTVSHSDADTALASGPNYGYRFSTSEDGTMVTDHSVMVTGLSGGTTYYFRTVSHGSPEVYGPETTVTTNIAQSAPAPSGGGGGGGGGGGIAFSTYSVRINNNAATTNSQNVSLSLTTIGGLDQMWVSNTNTFETGNWVPFKSSYPWSLTSGPGVKTVFVRFGTGSTTNVTAQASIRLVDGGQVVEVTPTVLGASRYNFTRTLILGSRGDEVMELQKRLATEGLYTGPVTGYFGPLTETAVKAYQTKNGLDPAGIVGPKTRAVLNK